MRTAVLAAVVLVSLFLTSRVEAQVSPFYDSRVYTLNLGPATGAYPPFGYGGVYPGQSYTGQSYVGQSYSVPYGYPAAGYGSPGYFAQTPLYTNPYYSGFTRYAQYHNRRYGGGRMFNSYFPQYQGETSGVFDR